VRASSTSVASASLCLQRAGGEIDRGAEQGDTARQREALLLEPEQDRQREPGPGGVAGQRELLGIAALIEQPQVGPGGVLESGRKRVLRREPVLRDERGGLRLEHQGADEPAESVGRAHHVAASVQVEQARRLLGRRRHDEGGYAAGVQRSNVDLRRRRQPGQQRLVLRPHLLQVRVDRHLVQQLPEPGDPAGELPADGSGGGDRIVEVGEKRPGADEQRFARQRQLDAMG
jgi:hypothetical protein